jgi:DnaK suppressor protein
MSKCGTIPRGTTMGPAELRRYKKLLLETQQELSFGEPLAESPAPRGGGTEGDLADIANADAEAELQVRLRQSETHLLRAIDEALARMRRGSYGICETCQQPISKARLEAVPWARHCRACEEAEHPAA